MNQPVIQSVALPQYRLISRALPRIDYADAFRLPIPADCRDAAFVARAVFSTAPGWVEMLLRLRNALVAPFGLKTEPGSPVAPIDGEIRPGHRIGIFPVLACTPEEILMGEDDRHLNFRVSVLLETEGAAENSAVISTAVQFNNRLGRLYFVPVRPIHRLIVPAMLRQGVRRLSV